MSESSGREVQEAVDQQAQEEAQPQGDAAPAQEAALEETALAETAPQASAATERDFSYTQNRELSWLQFDKRVLEEALDISVPLCTRLEFVSIFESNLDEFFMVRVGSLTDMQVIAPDDRDNKSNMTPAEQLDAIYAAVRPLMKMRDKIYKGLHKELEEYGIEEVDLRKADKAERKFARDWFSTFLRPILSPQVIDSRHPFPHLKNKALYVAALLTGKKGEQVMGIVPVPEEAPSLLYSPGDPLKYVRTEQVIARYMGKLFDIYKVGDPVVITVTRNADISFDEEKFADDEGDYRLYVSRLLKKRNRLNPVRLEVQGAPSDELLEMLLERLELARNQLFVSKTPLSVGDIFSFEKGLPPELKEKLCTPSNHPRQSAMFETGRGVIEQVCEQDRILFYPYDSIDPFLHLLSEAAEDPKVVSIKITLYRLASDSRIARYLCDAAENGKEVTVLMELRARFDEANNIDWSEHLEEAGCTVVYGMEHYKCHSKICLVTRREADGSLTKLTQIGTGNYNEKTARLYTDICFFTADEAIGRDAVAFFQNMMIGNLQGTYEKLLVAPSNMKSTLLDLIARETGKGPDGRIVIKANSVTDRDVIDALARASATGVDIRMNIRGICCLLPGIEGKTENVHVRSIVGRFLEHSRIYQFGAGDDLQVYIASADCMTRNLVHRVEIACPIEDADMRASISLFLEKIFNDDVKSRVLLPDGTYEAPAQGLEPFCMHDWCTENPLQAPVRPTKRAKGVRMARNERAAKRAESNSATDAAGEGSGGLLGKLRGIFK